MVAVNEGAPPANEQSDARYYLSAAEAGAMDVFFQAGHIVFNAGTYTLEESDSVEKRYEVRNLAQDGGAAFALHIEMEFERPGSNSIRPTSASYAMMEIGGSGIVRSGSLAIESGREGAPEELSFDAGRTIAEEILSAWSSES